MAIPLNKKETKKETNKVFLSREEALFAASKVIEAKPKKAKADNGLTEEQQEIFDEVKASCKALSGKVNDFLSGEEFNDLLSEILTLGGKFAEAVPQYKKRNLQYFGLSLDLRLIESKGQVFPLVTSDLNFGCNRTYTTSKKGEKMQVQTILGIGEKGPIFPKE